MIAVRWWKLPCLWASNSRRFLMGFIDGPKLRSNRSVLVVTSTSRLVTS